MPIQNKIKNLTTNHINTHTDFKNFNGSITHLNIHCYLFLKLHNQFFEFCYMTNGNIHYH